MKELVRAGKRIYLRCEKHGGLCHFNECVDKEAYYRRYGFTWYRCGAGFTIRAYEGKQKSYPAVKDSGENYHSFRDLPLGMTLFESQKAQACICQKEKFRGYEK